MFAFVVSRVLQAVPVVLAVGLIAYAMFAFVGDPVTVLLGQDYTEAQRLALSTGRALRPVPPDVIAATARQMQEAGPEAAVLHLESIKRTLDREAPDYRH